MQTYHAKPSAARGAAARNRVGSGPAPPPSDFARRQNPGPRLACLNRLVDGFVQSEVIGK